MDQNYYLNFPKWLILRHKIPNSNLIGSRSDPISPAKVLEVICKSADLRLLQTGHFLQASPTFSLFSFLLSGSDLVTFTWSCSCSFQGSDSFPDSFQFFPDHLLVCKVCFEKKCNTAIYGFSTLLLRLHSSRYLQQ